MPSGWARARSAIGTSGSQGKSGSRPETDVPPTGDPGGRHGRTQRAGVGHSSCSCGGSAATSGWSFSMTPILAAPPGEPRSSKNSTLAV